MNPLSKDVPSFHTRDLETTESLKHVKIETTKEGAKFTYGGKTYTVKIKLGDAELKLSDQKSWEIIANKVVVLLNKIKFLEPGEKKLGSGVKIDAKGFHSTENSQLIEHTSKKSKGTARDYQVLSKFIDQTQRPKLNTPSAPQSVAQVMPQVPRANVPGQLPQSEQLPKISPTVTPVLAAASMDENPRGNSPLPNEGGSKAVVVENLRPAVKVELMPTKPENLQLMTTHKAGNFVMMRISLPGNAVLMPVLSHQQSGKLVYSIPENLLKELLFHVMQPKKNRTHEQNETLISTQQKQVQAYGDNASYITFRDAENLEVFIRSILVHQLALANIQSPKSKEIVNSTTQAAQNQRNVFPVSIAAATSAGTEPPSQDAILDSAFAQWEDEPPIIKPTSIKSKDQIVDDAMRGLNKPSEAPPPAITKMIIEVEEVAHQHLPASQSTSPPGVHNYEQFDLGGLSLWGPW